MSFDFFLPFAAVGFVALFAIIGAQFVPSGGVRRMFVTGGVGLLLLPGIFLVVAFNPWLVDGRFRAYRNFYRELSVGMSRDEVLTTLHKTYPPSGKRKRPTIMRDEPNALGFFMHPEGSREPNCEGIFIEFQNGRISRLRYSPD